jgi:CrcB protein
MPARLAVLAAGGIVGCLARYLTTSALPTPHAGWPTGTFVVNLVGCLALGLLLEHLSRRGPDADRQGLLRLGLGTGMIGTFTTYSTFAVEIDLLVRDGAPCLAAGYAASSVIGGLLAMAAGVGIAAASTRRLVDIA